MKYIAFISVILFFSAGILPAQNDNSEIRKGNKQYKEGKFKEAEIDYRKALEKAPKSIKGEYNLGNSLYKQSNWEEAGRSYLNSAGKMKEKDAAGKAAAYYNLGNSYLKAEKYAEGIEAYKQSLRLNPNDQDTRYNLSYAMKKLQQQQQQQQKNEQKKDDKKDNKDKQQQNQPQDQNNQQQDKQQQQKQQISKQDAERMLQALKNDEQKTIDKVKKQKVNPVQVQVEKDW
ncbi:MAG: tetratricopeptide repeat protein [Lentimicrobium sp.]